MKSFSLFLEICLAIMVAGGALVLGIVLVVLCAAELGKVMRFLKKRKMLTGKLIENGLRNVYCPGCESEWKVLEEQKEFECPCGVKLHF